MSEEHGGTRKPKGRSPSYPAINLEVALQRAQEVYARDRQHPTPVTGLPSYWGYRSLNGPASLSLAALKKFGLLEDEGSRDARRARVTDLAVSILAHPDATQRKAAIEEAALRPAIHQEMWDRYGPSLPSDANLLWELTRDRGFTESGAKEFLREYKATIAYAELSEPTQVPPQEQAHMSPQEQHHKSSAEPTLRSGEAERRTSDPGVSEGTLRAFPIPLLNGGTVVVEGAFPVPEQDWDQFMAVLAAMKPGLVIRPSRETAAPLNDHRAEPQLRA